MELLTLFNLIIGLAAFAYFALAYTLAITVLLESKKAGEYVGHRDDLIFDVCVAVIAPISIPIILAYERWGDYE